MKPKEPATDQLYSKDPVKMNRALRYLLLESPEHELREALGDSAFDALAASGKDAAQRALSETESQDGQGD